MTFRDIDRREFGLRLGWPKTNIASRRFDHGLTVLVYPDSLKSREKFLAVSDWTDSVARMIQSGFLSEEDRKALTALARDG
ncbi:MAG TPA: hypothetical protein VMU78_07540, partial [Methylocella sp.]|nr:hypothetical protein [Methylocella sp.]